MNPQRGEKYQGKPCCHGHSGIRYRIGSICVECAKLAAIAQREKRKHERVALTEA